MMKIYLVRHAHAVDGEDDDARRRLAPRAANRFARWRHSCRWNKELGTREFWHSPAVRAQDTAERLAARLKTHGKARGSGRTTAWR